MKQYLSGPWRADPFNSTYTGAPLSWTIRDCYGNDIAEVDRPSGEDVEPFEAIAKVITMAPDLMLAVKRVQGALNSGLLIGDPKKVFNGGMMEFVELVNMINLAVYKLEGPGK